MPPLSGKVHVAFATQGCKPAMAATVEGDYFFKHLKAVIEQVRKLY